MLRICQHICITLLLALPLAACGVGGGLSKSTIDDSIQTNTVEVSPQVNPTQTSDANVIGNAVSATDLNATSGSPIPWANQTTGSSGKILEVSESNKDGVLCRDFKTSRESFEGVAMYTGKTCMTPSKQWLVDHFAAL